MGSYTFADLFAGCGGLSLGLLEAGLRGRFAIERDAMAFETFSTNFLDGNSPAGSFDWPGWLERRAWDVEDLLERHRGELKMLRGTVDILAGGPPCQGFSFAGRRVEDDPRNLLFRRYVEVVAAIKPQAIVLENVPGMQVAHSDGNVIELKSKAARPRRQSYYDRLVESLRTCGYEVASDLVDASRFGVPQRRSRLIAIGIRKDLLPFVPEGVTRGFELLEQARVAQLRELGLGERVQAREALSDLEVSGRARVPCTDGQSKPGFEEVRYSGPSTDYQRLMQEQMSGPMDSMRLARHRPDVEERFARILAECRKGVRMDDESRRAYGIKKHRIYPMSAAAPAPTITTLPDDVLHYAEPRILTVRESARLQSFPDWFRFRGKFTTGGDRRSRECPRYTQVGNAVPPYLARAIGTALARLLDEATLCRTIFGQPAHHGRKAASA
jgi:DNA (cytosine-5)-methyltransferase 1